MLFVFFPRFVVCLFHPSCCSPLARSHLFQSFSFVQYLPFTFPIHLLSRPISHLFFFYLPARPSRHLLRFPSPNLSSPESRLSKPIVFPSTLAALSITHFAKRRLPILLSQIHLLCILPDFQPDCRIFIFPSAALLLNSYFTLNDPVPSSRHLLPFLSTCILARVSNFCFLALIL